jgi:hypothetical protein
VRRGAGQLGIRMVLFFLRSIFQSKVLNKMYGCKGYGMDEICKVKEYSFLLRGEYQSSLTFGIHTKGSSRYKSLASDSLSKNKE